MIMAEIRQLELDGLLEIIPKRHRDERGFFSEVWREDVLREAGVETSFIQDNHSFSVAAGVLRGLHFQDEPAAQDKLVRVGRGSIFDVAVDVRPKSTTFGKWAGLTLSAPLWNQLFVPRGFAHGFVTLEPDTEVLYKVSNAYSPEHERTIKFDDPQLGIIWPAISGKIIVSDKDRSAPSFADLFGAR